MADWTATMDAILDVAQAAAPLIHPDAPEAIALGHRIVELIDHATDAFEGSDAEVVGLLAQRAAIEERVNTHIDSTVAKLKG